jgi:hypothetical protein
MNRTSSVVAVAVGAIAMGCIGVAGVGAAVAAAHGGTIHGCVAKSNGALRVVKQASACGSDEKSLSFNARGPRGPQGPAGSSGTFQMYANVDAEGDLGSNFGATKAEATQIPGQYVVTFAQPIGSCAAVAQSGKAGGDDFAGAYPSIVNFEGTNAFIVAFVNPANNQETATPFMVTVTCHN